MGQIWHASCVYPGIATTALEEQNVKTPLLIPMILAASVSLIACDGPVEPLEAPVSVIPNADGATQDVPTSNSGSGAETGVAPYGQDPAHPDPEKDEDAATEATGSTVEGSNQSPAAGSPTPDVRHATT